MRNVFITISKQAKGNIETKIKNLKRMYQVCKTGRYIRQDYGEDPGNSFVILKGHKENFLNRPTTRFINSSKNEIGRISKYNIDQINNKLVSKLIVN